jgi:hypothetical protein
VCPLRGEGDCTTLDRGVGLRNGSPWHAERRAGLQRESAVRREVYGASMGVRGTPRGVRGSEQESVARREVCRASTGVRGTPRGVRGFNGSPWHAERCAGLQRESVARREVCRASTGVRGTSKGVWGSERESVARRKVCRASTGVRGTPRGVCDTWKTGARRAGGASKTEAGGALNKRALTASSPASGGTPNGVPALRVPSSRPLTTRVVVWRLHPGEVQCLSQGAGRAGEPASLKSAVLLQ